MSDVLEAARRLAEHPMSCGCGSGGFPVPCPRKRLPQIVAALEAAERVVDGAGIETVNASDLQALAAALRGGD